MEKTPINEKSQPPQSSAPETEVTGDVPSSNSRKGKRQLDSGIDLQPVPKKSYNLRSRKSNFSEEEVSAKVPTTNRRTGKRPAESDPDLQASSKKPHNPRNKIFSISDDEDYQEEKESIFNEVEDMKETQKMNAKVSVGENMGDVGSQLLKQCINKGIEDMKQTGEVNKTIATEEAKRDLGCQKEDSMGDKVEKVRDTLDMSTSEPVEKVEEELVSREGKESINEDIEERNEIAKVNRTIFIGRQKEDSMDEKVEHVRETLVMSTSATVNKVEGELGSQNGKESINEEMEDIKETAAEVNTPISIEEGEGDLNGKESINEEMEDIKETAAEVNTPISIEEGEGDLGSQNGKESINEEMEDIKETAAEVNTPIAIEKDEGDLGSQEGKKSIDEGIEDRKETVKLNATMAIKESKGELGSQKGKESINEDVDDVKETVEVNTTIATKEAMEDLGCQNEDSIGENIVCVRETVDMSSGAHEEKVEGELGSQEGRESINEDIDDVKETVEVKTTIAIEEAREDLGSQEGKESINEDIADMKETVEVNTKIAIEEAMGDWVCQKEDSVDEKVESVRETLDISSTEHVAKVEGELGSQEGKDSINEDIANIKEIVEVNTKNAIEEAMGDLGEEVSEKETEDTVDSWELSSSRCTVDSQEETEDEVVYAKENAEAKDDQSSSPVIPKTSLLRSSSPVVPKTSLPTRSKIVFVGNLPYSIRRNSVVKFFEDVGSVVDIRMPKNADGSTKGFCHVTFATYAAALKALEKNGEMLCNRSVKLDLAEALRNRHMLERTVLVRGLQRNQRENDIRKSLLKHFEDCGGIKKVHVPKDIQSGDSTRVAFIQFEDSEAVPKAVELCGSELGNCKLFVKEVSRSRFRR